MKERTKTTENRKAGFEAMAKVVFPPKAALTQKRHMRRFLQKPKGQKIHELMARLCELNNLLPKFPVFGDPPPNTKLPEDEIKETAECALSHKLQRQIRLQGFEVCEKETHEFISLVARLEEIVPEETDDVSDNTEPEKKTTKKTRKRKREKSANEDGGEDHHCAPHGHNRSHNTKECRNPKSPRDDDKGGKSNDQGKTRSKTKNKKPEKYSQEEMNAMVSEAVKNIVKKQHKKNRNVEKTSEEDINLLEDLKMSSDSDDQSDVISAQSDSS